MLTTLALPPGVYRNGTEYQALNRWYDANLVRWFEGTLRPVGGWRPLQGGSPLANYTVSGKARGSYSWRGNNNFVRYGAIGTNTNLYAFRSGSELFDITPSAFTPGNADATANTGYGAGLYGNEAYGVPRQELGDPEPAMTWSLDNFGEFLVACAEGDGVLYVWDLDETGVADPIVKSGSTDVPTDCHSLIVSPERFLFALGANGNTRLVYWSDQEDYTQWDISALTQSGSFELQTNSSIRASCRVRGQVLILTGEDAHVATYVGPPFIYGFEAVAESCGVVSNRALVVADNKAIWMSEVGFYVYDGYVRKIPCDVSDYVFQRMNRDQQSKVYAVHDGNYSEIWWFYPDGNENDSYVVYNYAENHWNVGTIARTCGMDRDIFNNPILVDPDGNVLEHEVGFDYDDAEVYAESGPLQIGEGDRTLMVRELIPDEGTQGQVQARFSTKWYPNGTEYDFGPYSMANPTSVRFSGRQFKARIESNSMTDWRVGNFRFDVVPGGRR